MRVVFSQTVRTHMRDPSLYTAEKTWTSEENATANALLSAIRQSPNAAEAEWFGNVQGCEKETERVWKKLNSFPHIFEVLAARGEDLMRYDLHGQPRTAEPTATTLTHLTFRGWTVALKEFDELLEKGVLEPSTWELLAHLLRPSLPRDVLLRQAHVLRSQKTGPEHLPRYFKNPRIQIFPYRSNSKQWALFFITEKKGADDTEGYELRAVMPRNYDKEAFAWAISHLKFQFRTKEEPTFEEWPSNHGAQLLLA